MKILTIRDFLGLFEELQAKHWGVVFYFRGESITSWELRPSIMRDSLIQYEGEMLTDLIARRPNEFDSSNTAISQFVLAQHHGLRTRFLDVAKNPLVALFHACQADFDRDGRVHIFAVRRNFVKAFNSDTVSIISNFAKLPFDEQNMLLTMTASDDNFNQVDVMRHLYQLIREEKPFFEERIDIGDFFSVFVVEPQQSSERIRAQSGAFLASAFHRRFERDEILRHNDRIPVYAHYTPTIPFESKETITRELRLVNITREALFPGLDESARAVTVDFQQRLQEAETTADDPY